MIYDYNYFLRRYEQIEADFLEITDFIELKPDLGNSCYKVGSSKLMDFCLKVGSEVETLLKVIICDDKFKNSRKAKDETSINKYRTLIEPMYNLSNYELLVKPINRIIKPFDNFNIDKPEWFPIYSKSKHDKLTLINEWNLKHSLFALGCLLILVINHPSLENKEFKKHSVSQNVFDLLNSEPRFCGVITTVKF